ncbi:MazG nucleotide pyrophosphohydrolase domain-containing protein [Natronincola ferrireducens]|uniref:MazG nucleotide pyrophosphohydrolase domain-containing protein n=1 Tax=Natronincola ferrireducens TaxID=393762 RepID=A0A1G9CDP0_9FIRM|nr:MazG nucleotide pyrophosphohydrolase domain-containing protein [Natronincola ferrireducens]SDK49762.1 MazG nucleotide pyrophosphohydrolase domain-containing protein [Natronincola ferrireducens]
MDIRDAVEMIWDNRKYITNDAKTAISHLNEEVAESLKALMKDDLDKAKRELQDAMSCLFIAMKVLDVDVEESVNRQIEQMKKRNSKIMIFKEDKVEIYVDGTLKGGWSIWGNEDIREAEKLAKEFGCEIRHEFDKKEQNDK